MWFSCFSEMSARTACIEIQADGYGISEVDPRPGLVPTKPGRHWTNCSFIEGGASEFIFRPYLLFPLELICREIKFVIKDWRKFNFLKRIFLVKNVGMPDTFYTYIILRRLERWRRCRMARLINTTVTWRFSVECSASCRSTYVWASWSCSDTSLDCSRKRSSLVSDNIRRMLLNPAHMQNKSKFNNVLALMVNFRLWPCYPATRIEFPRGLWSLFGRFCTAKGRL